MATIIKQCEHRNYRFHRAEPDVGIPRAYSECDDCGMLGDMVEDADEDGRYFFPAWDDEGEAYCEVEGCEADEVAECPVGCGAYHCADHPHTDEEGER